MKLIVSNYPFYSPFQFWHKRFFDKDITTNFPITIEASEDILRKFIDVLKEEIRLGKDFLTSNGEFEFELIYDPELNLKMKAQELKLICRIGWVTEILSENQVEITFDTEDGIEKAVYTIPKHDLSEGIKVGERICLSKIYD